MSTAPTPDTPLHVIFGATGGIGTELCRRLQARGDRLVIASRTPDRVHALAQELGAHGVPLDATDAAAVDRCIDETIERSGPLSGVASCIGSILLKPAHRTSDAEWTETLQTNLGTAFHILRAATRTMSKTGGSIVLVSTAAAEIGIPNHEAIAAAKAGVAGLVRAAAATYAPRGIRVNAVAPGLVETPLTRRLISLPANRTASEAMHALGRLGTPGDIASLMSWLLDPEQSWVTGQVIAVDGGLSTLRTR